MKHSCILHQCPQILIFTMDILFKGTLECLNFNDVYASDEIANCTLHIINRYRMSKWSLGGSNSNTMQLQFYNINLNPIFF